jgi:hypothetical protein
LHIFSKIYYSPSSAMLLLFNVEKWNAWLWGGRQ